MAKTLSLLTVWIGLCGSGCASMPEVRTGSIRCMHPYRGGSFAGFFSFARGELNPPFRHLDRDVDLLMYYDADDCANGALISRGEDSGRLYPVGHKSWAELSRSTISREAIEGIPALAPLTRDLEGLAFLVETSGGTDALVRIRTLQPATYDDFLTGRFPVLIFEWTSPPPGPAHQSPQHTSTSSPP